MELNDEKMIQADQYKYLGLIFHRSLGCFDRKSINLRRKYQSFVGLKYIDYSIERIVSDVRINEDGRWVALTENIKDRLLEPIEFDLHKSSYVDDLKRMISQYDLQLKTNLRLGMIARLMIPEFKNIPKKSRKS